MRVVHVCVRAHTAAKSRRKRLALTGNNKRAETFVGVCVNGLVCLCEQEACILLPLFVFCCMNLCVFLPPASVLELLDAG